MTTLSIVILLATAWALAHAKTSRPDGTLVRDLHPYRKLMSFVMPTRNESVVYFESYLDATELLRYVEESSGPHGADITHCIVAATCAMMAENPTMNRFAIGRRLYDREGIFITFSMKRKKLDKKAKLATVKIQYQPGQTFTELCAAIESEINTERSEAHTYADKEFDLFKQIPRPLMRGAVSLLRTLDYFNLLPAAFIRNDPFYTSMFVANLGSLRMGAGFHHLYEWGTCSAFAMAGQIEDRPVVVDGEVRIQPTLHIRYTYDERVDDGLSARSGIETIARVLQAPYDELGCLAENGSDAYPLDRNAPPLG